MDIIDEIRAFIIDSAGTEGTDNPELDVVTANIWLNYLKDFTPPTEPQTHESCEPELHQYHIGNGKIEIITSDTIEGGDFKADDRHIHHHYAGHCPVCGGHQTEGKSVEIDGKTAIQECYCLNPKCSATWRDIYTLRETEVSWTVSQEQNT